ncbi:hypothetical protein HanXRQr2_Chr06g0260091 [Helianthus annuus]|uniref:Uncharacterized protein n=1 Tax=Helianthus annuus TaxID=4232 RepID=A0A9K3NJH1_HELAN|nr:hypothetical protein HanXRQr2_Chr06g0260091 [Helianthus annuus]
MKENLCDAMTIMGSKSGKNLLTMCKKLKFQQKKFKDITWKFAVIAINEIGGMWRHVTSFAASIVVSLFRLSIDCCEILF